MNSTTIDHTKDGEYTLEQGRAYIHNKCGGATVVTGEDLSQICYPFSAVRRAKCAACGDIPPLAEFVWHDTGEPIPDFRQRMFKEKAPAVWQWWWKSAPWLFAAGGIILAATKGQGFDPGGLVVGALLGFAIGFFVGRPIVVDMFCRNDFWKHR